MIFWRLILSLMVPTIIGAGGLTLISRLSSIEFQSYLARYAPKTSLKVSSKIFKELGLPLFLILSFALGTGLTTYLMFWSGLLGLPLKFFVIILSIVAAIISIIFLYHWLRTQKGLIKFHLIKPHPRLTFIEIILILIILFQIVFVFSNAILRPHIYADILVNWGWRAKVFFEQPSEAFNPQSPFWLASVGYRHYPLHISLLMTWVYLWLGQVNDALVNIIFAFYFLCLLGFIYFCLRSATRSDLPDNRTHALIFTTFLATLPFLAIHGFIAYADLTLTFYFTLAAIFLFRGLTPKTPNPKYEINLILAGIFTGLVVWIKNTGLVLAAIFFIVLFIYSLWEKNLSCQIIKNRLWFVICSSLFILPWLIFKHLFISSYSVVPPVNQFHPEVFSHIFRQIFLWPTFHIWPAIFVLILIIGWQKILVKANFSLLLIILGVTSAYFILYFFTSSYQYAINATSTSRHFLVLIPLSVFLAGILMEDKKC